VADRDSSLSEVESNAWDHDRRDRIVPAGGVLSAPARSRRRRATASNLVGAPNTNHATGRLSCPPNPALFTLLYEKQAERDQVEVLPHLLQIDAAHLLMLSRAQLIPEKTAAQLLRVNRELWDVVLKGGVPVPMPKPHRGFYLLYEREYIRRLGKQVGGAAHLARSRNDINATVTRLRLRQQLLDLLEEFCALANAIVNAGTTHAATFLCGFTHQQPAQPSTLGHYFAGTLAELMRSAELLDRAFDLVNVCPMGAAAGFGTSFPIARGEVAQSLGFAGVVENAADAVASRDYIVHVLSPMAMLGTTLTRISTDLGNWSNQMYGFIGWDDDLVSTSSIMPQKRNAFVLENIRGAAIQPLGCLLNTLTGMKNLSFSNSVELSAEATSHVWSGMTSLQRAMRLTRILIENLQADSDRMLQCLLNTQVSMTALADWLVCRYGLGFRAAHDAVSRLVIQFPTTPGTSELKAALEQILAEHPGDDLAQDNLPEFRPSRRNGKANQSRIRINHEELASVIDPIRCAERAAYGGGPAPVSVRAQLRSLARRTALLEDQRKRRGRQIRYASVELRKAQADFVYKVLKGKGGA
jgi:argininosuccinate lyase